MRKSGFADMNPEHLDDLHEQVNFPDAEFQRLLDQCKVPMDLQDHLVEEGFLDLATFAFAFSTAEKFDEYLIRFQQKAALEDTWLHSPPASSLRFLFHRASQEMKSSNSRPEPQASTSSASIGGLLDLAWADLPPSRVKEADILQMKRNFIAKYPSEHLDSNSMPCSRYIAQIVQQQSRTSYVWIPWKEIISESRWIELQEKGKKR